MRGLCIFPYVIISDLITEEMYLFQKALLKKNLWIKHVSSRVFTPHQICGSTWSQRICPLQMQSANPSSAPHIGPVTLAHQCGLGCDSHGGILAILVTQI